MVSWSLQNWTKSDNNKGHDMILEGRNEGGEPKLEVIIDQRKVNLVNLYSTL